MPKLAQLGLVVRLRHDPIQTLRADSYGFASDDRIRPLQVLKPLGASLTMALGAGLRVSPTADIRPSV